MWILITQTKVLFFAVPYKHSVRKTFKYHAHLIKKSVPAPVDLTPTDDSFPNQFLLQLLQNSNSSNASQYSV